MDITSQYSREQALRDGLLIDVTLIANELGLNYETAISAFVHAHIQRGQAIHPQLDLLEEILKSAKYFLRRNKDWVNFGSPGWGLRGRMTLVGQTLTIFDFAEELDFRVSRCGSFFPH